MAKRKPSTPHDRAPLEPFPIDNIPRDPETLAKFAEDVLEAMAESNQRIADREAERVVAKAAERKERGRPTPRRDIAAVNRRLRDVTNNLMAIHRISMDAVDADLAERQDLLLLIRETARSSARAVDVCAQRLGETFPVGCFADELESD